MGGLSLNPLRSRDVKSKLPVYENLNSKERDSNDWTDESDYEEGYSVTDSPSTGNSRVTSTSTSLPSSQTPIMAKRTFSLPRRPGRTMGYRLPNKVVRYMCFGLVSTILLFMFSLIRASQNDNRRLTSGLISKRPPPPPVWEQYPFLTRYYGGVRNMVSFQKNEPEYPRPQDEPPIDKLAFVNFTYSDPNAEESQGKGADLASRDLPSSKEFEKHPKSIFNMKPEDINECFLDKEKKLRVPPIRYLDGRPNGFPEAVLGSYDLLNFSEDICYERYGRYSPYGMGYSQRTGGLGVGENGEKEGMDLTWEKTPKVDWRNVDWADAQKRCYQANAPRYSPVPKRISRPHGFHIMDGVTELPDIAAKVNSTLATRDASPELSSAEGKPTLDKPAGDAKNKENASNKISRTAVVVRCWDEYNWREEDIMYMRSLITEVSLASGGRYDVHLLVQVKNEAKYPVWADAATYEQRIKDAIPQEFQGLATLWSETQMLSLYQGIHDLFTRGPDLPVHGVYRGLSMALQYFADQHPEYDYFWQWEMDIRYTGHYYDFFTKVENWSKEQPRKGLWERNGRYYVPSVHGTWEDFKQMARVQAEMGTSDPNNMWEGVLGNKKGKGKQPAQHNSLVWGPERSSDPEDWFEPDNDPQPPTSMERDKYVWGVGEEADYITFNPLFDPEGTTWLLADDITGYKEKPPRRAQIITASRLSRKLLMTMHRETAFKKHFAFPEMWPGTVALQHGYKGVFVPHPLYVDREWPTAVLASTLNNGKNSATGGARTSVFGQREHNLRGITWFYDSGFAPNLYRRWLGLKVNNDGGEEFELTEDKSKNGATVGDMRGGEGRMCLPPMLLHPIKDVELPVEAVVVEGTEFPESDPNA